MKNKKGYVLIYSVIILGMVVLAAALYLNWLGIFSLQNKKEKSNSKIAQSLADTCAENALQAIWNNANASGTITRNNLFEGNCSYTINISAGENREIRAIGTVENTTRKTKVLINQVNAKVNVTSWQEVADF